LVLVLRKEDKVVTTMAIVDSGADVCIFPASLAESLGISIPNQNVAAFSGTSQDQQLVYFETVQVTLWNANDDEEPIVFDLYAGFCRTIEHTGLGILGQYGFFSRFTVIFDQANNVFSVD